jgi:cytoplasmic FMR1 interacting protein
VTVLLEGMPSVCKLPLFDYKASGCLAFYHLRLIEVIGHKELQTSVYHSFREVGNLVTFLILLEECLV